MSACSPFQWLYDALCHDLTMNLGSIPVARVTVAGSFRTMGDAYAISRRSTSRSSSAAHQQSRDRVVVYVRILLSYKHKPYASQLPAGRRHWLTHGVNDRPSAPDSRTQTITALPSSAFEGACSASYPCRPASSSHRTAVYVRSPRPIHHATRDNRSHTYKPSVTRREILG